MNKKGNLLDVVDMKFALISLFIVLLYLFLTFEALDSNLQNSTEVTQEAKDIASRFRIKLPRATDYVSVMVYLGFLLFSVIAARFINTNKVFLVIAVIWLIVISFGSMLFANLWDKMLNMNQIQNFSNNFPITTWMFDNLVLLSLTYIVIVGITLYMKTDITQR
jgi:hypothetical protein